MTGEKQNSVSPSHQSWWQRLTSVFSKKPPVPVVEEPEPEEEVCCQGKVHIAYRGLADDRMYMAYSRKWKEIRFFRQNGLRAFCADCRRRLL